MPKPPPLASGRVGDERRGQVSEPDLSQDPHGTRGHRPGDRTGQVRHHRPLHPLDRVDLEHDRGPAMPAMQRLKVCMRVRAGDPQPCTESKPNHPQAWCGVCRGNVTKVTPVQILTDGHGCVSIEPWQPTTHSPTPAPSNARITAQWGASAESGASSATSIPQSADAPTSPARTEPTASGLSVSVRGG